jgi:chromosome segregation ATPase
MGIDQNRLRHIAEIAAARAAFARTLTDRGHDLREERDRLQRRVKELNQRGPDITGGAGVEIARLEARIDELNAERAEDAARLETVNAELAQARALEARCREYASARGHDTPPRLAPGGFGYVADAGGNV